MNQHPPAIDPKILRQRVWIEQEISRCEREKFFGELQIKYEGGRIATVKRVETLKPPERE